MNVKILRAVVSHLERDSANFDMLVGVAKIQRQRRKTWSQWLLREPYEESCGTACCIAGTTYVLYSVQAAKKIRALQVNCQLDWNGAILPFAQKMLGLTNKQALDLFFVSRWPEKFVAMYVDAIDGAERVQALKAAVEDFIATDGWAPQTEVALRIEGNDIVESEVKTV